MANCTRKWRRTAAQGATSALVASTRAADGRNGSGLGLSSLLQKFSADAQGDEGGKSRRVRSPTEPEDGQDRRRAARSPTGFCAAAGGGARGGPILSCAVVGHAVSGGRDGRCGGPLLAPVPYGVCVGGQKEEEEEKEMAKREAKHQEKQRQAADAMERARFLLEQAGQEEEGRRRGMGRCRNPLPYVLHARLVVPALLALGNLDIFLRAFWHLYVVCVLPEKCWNIGCFRILFCPVRQWLHVHTSGWRK